MATISAIFNNFINSWYFTALALGVVFIVVTAQAWKGVIGRLSLYIKKKDLTISTSNEEEQADVTAADDYAKIQATLSDLNIDADREFKDFLNSVKAHLLERNITKDEVRELIHSIFTIKEQYEFAYLNLFLVPNSKLALKTLDEMGAVIKEVFLSAIDLPADIADDQQQIIFNALLCHHLIEQSDGVCRVSAKGERWLEFVGLKQLSTVAA